MRNTYIRWISVSLVAAVALSGCNKIKPANLTDAVETTPSDTEIIEITIGTEPVETEIISAPAEELRKLEFNPHAFSSILYDIYGDDYRDSFFNLCDALMEGRDTFECTSEEVYEWCMNGVTLNQLCPVACCQITTKINDGDPSYENGTGHIYYQKSQGEFLERQKSFIEQVEEIKNGYIKPDYSDFEVCLALYDYIVSNYTYDYDGTLDRSEDGSGGACLRYKKGVCADFGAWYAYLLMQCGVNAIQVQNFGTGQGLGYHAWTFVDLDGKGYHIDVTWALKPEGADRVDLILDYFLMTDEDRAKVDYPPELTEVPLITQRYYYGKDCTEYDFTADDTTYRFPEYTYCKRFNAAENILYYYNLTVDNEEHEFKYE